MDITTITNIFRPVYGALVRGLSVLTPEWEQLQQLQNFEQMSPRSINWPVELTIGGGIAATSDGGSTARASSNEPVEATDSWAHYVGRFEASYDALDAENNSKFSRQQIVKQIKHQGKDKLRSFRMAIARNFYGHSTGILFLAEGTVSNPSGNVTRVRVKDLYGETGLAVPTRIREYVTVNKDYLNVHSGTTTTVRGGGKVIAINESTDDIDLDTSSYIGASIVAGDALVLNNQVLTGSADDMDLWMNGLLDLTRATTLHNIATSAQPDWVAGVDEASFGSVVGGADLYEWFREIEERSDYTVEWGYTEIGVLAQAGGAELDQRRYGASDDTMRLGFRDINSMGVTLQSRPYVPDGYLFLGSNSALKKLSPDERGVDDVIDDGDKMGTFKQYENQLGFYKDQIFRAQLTCVSRLGLGVVDGITRA